MIFRVGGDVVPRRGTVSRELCVLSVQQYVSGLWRATGNLAVTAALHAPHCLVPEQARRVQWLARQWQKARTIILP